MKSHFEDIVGNKRKPCPHSLTTLRRKKKRYEDVTVTFRLERMTKWMATSKKSNICILHRYPLSSSPGCSQIIGEFLRRGYNVFVVDLSEKAYEKNGCPILSKKYHHSLKIRSHKGEKNKMLNTISFNLFSVRPAISIMRENGVGSLLCINPDTILSGILVKRLLKVPMILYNADLLSAYLPFYNPKIPETFVRCLVNIERKMVSCADKIIVVSDAMRNFLIEGGIDEERIFVVPDAVDIKLFSPRAGNLARKAYGLGGNPIVMYHGTMERYQGVESLITAAPIVLEQVPNAKFVLIGAGSILNQVTKLVMQNRLSGSFVITGWLPRRDLPELIAVCDVGVVARLPGLANNMVVTTKLLEYLASGRPVVAPNLSAISEVVRDNYNGLLYAPGDPYDLAEKILVLLKNPKLAAEMGTRGRELVEQRHSWDTVSDRIVNEVEILMR